MEKCTLKEKDIPDKSGYIEFVPSKQKRIYYVVKRVFDVSLSIVLLVALAIPMAVLAFIVRIDSPGPVIFSQERLGKNGKLFLIYKFRSMYIDAEKDGPQWAKQKDNRCTKFGRFLRQTKLDELPQLWNILQGDMSFVGPRPERPYFYEKFETYIPGFHNRLAVKPGLTGWAQVNGGYELYPEEKIVYDMEYIKNQSFKMDLKCIIKTFPVVLFRKDSR